MLTIGNLFEAGKKDRLKYGILSFVISFLLFAGFNYCNDQLFLYLLIGVPLLFVGMFSIQTMFALSVITIFIDHGVFYFSGAQVMFYLFSLSFILNKKLKLKDLYNPYVGYFLIFLLSVLPSYYNAIDYYQPFVKFLNMIIFFFMITILPYYMDSKKKILKALNLFVLMGLLNSIHVLYLAFNGGGRVFGFTGVVFCDLSCLAFIIVFYRLLTGENKLLNLFLSVLILGGHLSTQTRNSTISLIATTLIMFTLFLFYHNRFSLNLLRSSLRIMAVFAVIVVSILAIAVANPSTFDRVTKEKGGASDDKSERIESLSTIATRYFIWSTAWNAFKAHPYIGIGLYKFSYASKDYNTFDKELFEVYVEGLASHQTEIGLLAETGIVGCLGYLVFIFFIYKRLFRNIRKKYIDKYWNLHLLVFVLNIFIFFAMIMSDAYIISVAIAVWGFILALAIAVERNMQNESLTIC